MSRLSRYFELRETLVNKLVKNHPSLKRYENGIKLYTKGALVITPITTSLGAITGFSMGTVFGFLSNDQIIKQLTTTLFITTSLGIRGALIGITYPISIPLVLLRAI